MNRRLGISLFVLVPAVIAAFGILIGLTMILMNQSSSPNVYPETEPEGIERRVMNISTDYIKDSPTFMFDGIEETLELEQFMIRETSPPQYVLTYNFNSRYAGYGDRFGQAVADVITAHRAMIILTVELVENGVSYEIDAAHIDGQWNILEQEFFPQKGLPGIGFLEGNVMIGPICPVQREGVPCIIPPGVYETRKIVISDEIRNIVDVVDIDGQGRYRVVLEPGFYTIDINKIGIDRSDNVPKEVEIRDGEVTIFDINIDTGIR